MAIPEKTLTEIFSEVAEILKVHRASPPPRTQPVVSAPYNPDRPWESDEAIRKKTLTEAVGEIAESIKALGLGVPHEAQSGPHEEVIVRYTDGTGRFSQDSRYIILTSKMYKLNGEADGHHEGVFETRVQDVNALLKWFDPPQPPLDAPGPVERIELRADTKAIWTFADNSSITAVGPAVVHLARFTDGSLMFFVSVAASITNGTGRYAGALGIKTALGGTYLRPGSAFGPGAEFPGKTIETFRVINRRDLAPLPDEPNIPADFPYQSKYIEVHGSRMHYIEEGEGDPILLLHGNPTWSYLWRNIIPHLKPVGRCIAPDLIGMGRSDKPDVEYRFLEHAHYLEGFIREMDLKNITLVVHDWGSALGFHYAMRYEQNVKGIAFMEALIKPYRSWDEFPASGEQFRALRDTFQRFRSGGEGGEGWRLIVEQNIFIENLLPQEALPRQLTEAEMKYYREPFREPHSRKPIWRWAKEIPIAGEPSDVTDAVTNYSSQLRDSELPMILFYADPGAIFTVEHVNWCKQNLKHLKVVDIGQGTHFLQEINPDLIGKELAQWYRELPQRR